MENKDGFSTDPGEATRAVRNVVTSIAREQGGTELSGGNLAAPKSTPGEIPEGGTIGYNRDLYEGNDYNSRKWRPEDGAYGAEYPHSNPYVY